jgi:hypothetical protein
MIHLEPTYLRHIYDGLIKGSIHPENSAELPDGLIGMYEKAFDERMSVIERQKLLQRFAIWALLKKEVSAAFVAEVLGESEDDIQEFISTYSSWFNSPESGKYQLYHERLKVYLLQKLSEREVHVLHEKLIGRLEQAIQKQNADEFEWYGLEFLVGHLGTSAMLDGNGSRLIDLAYSQTLWQRQLKFSRGYTWTNNGLLEVMTWASKFNDDEVIECGLQLVDLHHKEQNAAPQIVALVAEGDFDAALKLIERFGGSDKEGVQRKFIVYMLCMMELTLFDSKDFQNSKEGIELLLKHLDEQLPVDHSVLNWGEFFPSNLMFKILTELEKSKFEFNQILNKTLFFEYEWMESNKLFCSNELRVLKILGDYYHNQGIKNIIMLNEHIRHNESLHILAVNHLTDVVWHIKLLLLNAKYLFQNNYLKEAEIELYESLKITNLFQSVPDIFQSLQDIFKVALSCDFKEVMNRILVIYLDYSGSVEDEFERENKFLALIELAIEAQDFVLASKVLVKIEKPFYKCSGLIEITTCMLKNQSGYAIDKNIEEIICLIDQINNEFEKGEVQKEYSKLILKYKGIVDAIIFADNIKGGGGYFRDDALGDLAIDLINSSQIPSALDILETKDLVFFIEARVYIELSKHYLKHDNIDEAIRYLNVVTDDEEFDDRSKLLRIIVSALIGSEKEKRVFDLLVDFISFESEVKNDFISKTDLMFELYQINSKSVLQDVNYFLTDFDRAELFRRISICHLKNGEKKKFIKFLNRSISVVDLLDSDMVRDYIYEEFMRDLFEQGEYIIVEKLIDKLSFEHTFLAEKYRILCSLRTHYHIQEFKLDESRIIKKQSNLLKINNVPYEDVLAMELEFSEVIENNKISILKLCETAIATARKLVNIEKRTVLFSKVSTVLFKMAKFDESDLIMRDLIETTKELEDNIKMISSFKHICSELLCQLKIDKAISVAMLVPSSSDKNSLFKEIGVCSVLAGLMESALIAENLITDQQVRQQLWLEIEDERIIDVVDKESFVLLDQLRGFDSEYHYLKGWVKNQKVIKMDKEFTRSTLLRVKYNKSQIEPIINKFFLNQLFFGHITDQHLERVYKTSGLQWAIDIKNNLPN